jgi:hypothetical protein
MGYFARFAQTTTCTSAMSLVRLAPNKIPTLVASTASRERKSVERAACSSLRLVAPVHEQGVAAVARRDGTAVITVGRQKPI